MPKALTISQYIQALQALLEEHGDLEIWQTSLSFSPDFANLPEVANLEARFPMPKLKYGLPSDDFEKVAVIPGL